MRTDAIIMTAPGRIHRADVPLDAPGVGDVVVEVAHSAISTGTEKLLWEGRMPHFPGMGYPLVPGYEAVGTVVEAADEAAIPVGASVFVPGARCFGDVRGLFGAAAATLVTAASRVTRNPFGDSRGVLLALAATAHHAIAGGAVPDLIVGHGVVGRLLARIAIARGAPAPTVWERDPARISGAKGYAVTDGDADDRRDYRAIYDASGDAALIDVLVGRLEKGGEIVLAGFYPGRIDFGFVPAFMREARLRIAAEWTADDMAAVIALIEAGRLSFDGLITDRAAADDAPAAYARAFGASDCLKMILDWRAA